MQTGQISEGGIYRRLWSLLNRVRHRRKKAADAPAAANTQLSRSNDGSPAAIDHSADTFCVLAWNHLQITPNGTVKMCCIAGEDVHDNKQPMSLYADTYESIWNSPYMQGARRALAEGKPFPACTRCYQEEKSVGQSRRTIQNAAWLTDNEKSREELIDEARANEWKVLDRPISLQLNMGNLCNLACRMCSSQYSSKIENDPVHNKWMPAEYSDVARWQGSKLHFGPRPFFGVKYSGFRDYEATSPRWSTGSATIKFHIPEASIVVALGLKLRPAEDSASVAIRVNGQQIFEGRIGHEWTCRHEFAGRSNYPELELEIETTVTNVGGRLLGIGLLDAWIERANSDAEPLRNQRALTRLEANKGWWAQPEAMFDEILGQPDCLRHVILQGGEPFLVKQFDDILDHLIQNGSAGRVTFEIVSNLTVIKDSTLARLARLKQIFLTASIDGIGPILEYIRYPADWSEIEHNIQRLSGLSNVQISFATAVQAYNLLDLPNIMQYCDERAIRLHAHFLVAPRYLDVAVLPSAVRQIAIDRLSRFLDDNPQTANRFSAEYAIRFLREHLAVHYREDFVSFVKFTNDMDVSRGQNFQSLYPDLMDWFADDDLHWTSETMHADQSKHLNVSASI